MSIAERRERQRAERYERIVAAACALAEAEGWEAVTTRRLAGLIDYSQPVLYGHSKGKADILGAVAIRGFEELAARLRMSKTTIAGEPDILRKVCAAYLDLARSRPVIYEAMFVLPIDVKFVSEDTPSPLKAAFGELVGGLEPFDPHPDLRAEVTWAALHGLAVLRRGGRIPPEGHEERIDLLVSHSSSARNWPRARSLSRAPQGNRLKADQADCLIKASREAVSQAADLRRTLRLCFSLGARRRFMAIWRMVAMFCGPAPERSRLRSSWKTTSSIQCSRFSTCQWHRTAWANSLASCGMDDR